METFIGKSNFMELGHWGPYIHHRDLISYTWGQTNKNSGCPVYIGFCSSINVFDYLNSEPHRIGFFDFPCEPPYLLIHSLMSSTLLLLLLSKHSLHWNLLLHICLPRWKYIIHKPFNQSINQSTIMVLQTHKCNFSIMIIFLGEFC